MPTRTIDQYTVGIFCPMEHEMIAMAAMLDEEHPEPSELPPHEMNLQFGKLSQHNVVIFCLPAGSIGKVAACRQVSTMKYQFPFLRFILLVGVGGGVPSKRNDICLGDIVVSEPSECHPGLVEYDLGRELEHGDVRIGVLDRPSELLLFAIQGMKIKHDRGDSKIDRHLARAARKQASLRETYFTMPDRKSDHFYQSDYSHVGKTDCGRCDRARLVRRPSRLDTTPHVFYGNIASGDRIIMNAPRRDAIAGGQDIFCFDMESAGISRVLPYLVIRGIGNYADSHKNNEWQNWAAATASAYAKEILTIVAPLKGRRARGDYEDTLRRNVEPWSEEALDDPRSDSVVARGPGWTLATRPGADVSE